MTRQKKLATSSEQTQEAIWKQIAAIPAGRVCSYGRIAELAGKPRGARMVARALKQAPAELELPWHRVLKAGGVIAAAKVHSGHDEQIARLVAEGVVVAGGKVDLERFGWMMTIDELIWSEL